MDTSNAYFKGTWMPSTLGLGLPMLRFLSLEVINCFVKSCLIAWYLQYGEITAQMKSNREKAGKY